MSDQRCEHMMEAMDFVSDLSVEAKEFLKGADKEKIERMNANLEFYASSKAVWRFFLIGGSILVSFIVGAAAIWKTVGEYVSVKFK
jgi:hypothetical protein